MANFIVRADLGPDGRQAIALIRYRLERGSFARPSDRSNSTPEEPTKGRPLVDSTGPGDSATTIPRGLGGPSP